ncbi:hypothetical protein BGX23_008778 [Mortierella sp. AD031]|nr:hypothetical protein BGX23_008778 [Mortierella sp. AD031]
MISPTKGVVGFISLALSLTLISTPTHAQNAISPVSFASYTRSGNQFYIAGGAWIREIPDVHDKTKPQTQLGDGQFAVLDLGVPWNASTPAWKKLANGPKQFDFPIAPNADGTKLIAFRYPGSNASDMFAQIYDKAANTWSPSKIRAPNPTRGGIDAVTDPTTNTVYLAGGYETDDKLDQMYVYYWATDELKKIPMVATSMAMVLNYKAAWWSTEKSIVYYGGYARPSGDFAPADFITYTPTTNEWRTIQTTGTAPGKRANHCMAISDDGTKLVVFGGRWSDKFYQSIMSELWVLDLTTKVWERTDASTTVSSPIIIYDLKRKKYLSQFKGANPDTDSDPAIKNVAPPSNNNGNSGSRPGGNNSNNSSSNDSEGLTFHQRMGAIIGGVVGFAVLFWTTVACCILRVRRNRARKIQETMDESNRKQQQQKQQQQKQQAAKRQSTAATATAGAATNNNRASYTVRPAAIPKTQSPGSQPYPLLQTQGQAQPYSSLPPQQQGYPQTYPMLPLRHHNPQQQGSPQFYPALQQQEQHRLSKPAAPLPHQPGGSPQVISESAPPIYSSPYSTPRAPELVSVHHSDYADSTRFANSQSSFVPPPSGSTSAVELVRSPQLR